MEQVCNWRARLQLSHRINVHVRKMVATVSILLVLEERLGRSLDR
jgi:hypothetical protein